MSGSAGTGLEDAHRRPAAPQAVAGASGLVPHEGAGRSGRHLAAFLISGILVLRRLDALPRTDDAIVTANTIHVVPEVAGRIATLNVKDDASVRKGDVLFTIESERYELNLAQARAQAAAVDAQIHLADRKVSAEMTGIPVARANAETARARLKEATETLRRLEPLVPQGFVTAQQLDVAKTARATAESQLAAALSATLQTREAVGDSKALAAQLLGASALVGQAERDLRNTVVRAPFDGRIVGVTTSVGQWVDPVRPLFTLIDTSQWYIIADFRETEIPRTRPGDRVIAYVMTNPAPGFGAGRERGLGGRRSGESRPSRRATGQARPGLDPHRPALSGSDRPGQPSSGAHAHRGLGGGRRPPRPGMRGR